MTAVETETTLQLRTKKFALQSLLTRAATVVPSRDILPVLKNFLIEAEPGKVTVAATDMELTIIATSEMVTVEKEGTAVFPARQLLDIVREADDGELLLEVKDRFAEITVDRTGWTLSLQDGSDYPALPAVSEIEFHGVDRAKLLRAISAVRYAAATDSVRQNLMMIDISNNRLRTADGVRFQQVELGQTFPLSIQIPIGAVDDLVKTLQTTDTAQVEVGEDEDYLCFKVAEQVFVARKLNVTFPDVDEILLKPALTNDEELHVDRTEFISAVKKVRITADPDTSAVLLTLKGEKLVVSSRDKYGSMAHSELDVSWSGPQDKTVTVNHRHLLDMLTMADSSSCHFYLGAGKKNRPAPLLLRDESAGSVGVLNQTLSNLLH